MTEAHDPGPDNAVAVTGLAGRFPGAPDEESFWRLISEGREGTRFFSSGETASLPVDTSSLTGASASSVASPGRTHVPVSGVLEGALRFDAGFFGYTPSEAELMDPQQRIFLEVAWAALEDAGYRPDGLPFPVGVFGSQGFPAYLFDHLSRSGSWRDQGRRFQAVLANDKDFLATRVSYKLGLRGPALTVQTACSSSLVAVHLACQSLLSRECDAALAGGVRVHGFRHEGYLYEEGGVLSRDGHCRPFDAAATGCVPGDGAGVVVLRRLADAVAAGDSIRAVILGSAVNNDGSVKAGYTAPGVDAQASVIAEAMGVAGVDPRTISYVETHGTATPLGDPIEAAGLKAAFAAVGTSSPSPSSPSPSPPPVEGWCALGSVKANIGHLDAAAGIAGLIKVVLCLERRVIPGMVNFARLNPACGLDGSPFAVSSASREWDAPRPRRAGLSSFGMGGTNAHVILQEAPPGGSEETSPADAAGARPPGEAPEAGDRRRYHLVTLSARSETALSRQAARLARRLRERLAEGRALNPADVAYTLQVGRRAFRHRLATVAASGEEMVRALGRPEAKDGSGNDGSGDDGSGNEVLVGLVPPGSPSGVIFLFPGQGAQYPGMARGLYLTEPVFRAEFDRLASILSPELGLDLKETVFGGDPRRGEPEVAAEILRRTAVAQPALFAVEWAMARMLTAWGLPPAAMAGHSLGEFVAAALAGVFEPEQAASLVVERGRLIQGLPPGDMLAVSWPEDAVRAALAAHPEMSLAAVNAPDLCTVSGPPAAVVVFETEVVSAGAEARRLKTSHAFHSSMLDPVIDRFRDRVAAAAPRPPRRPYLSNVTGDWITADLAVDPNYWAEHLRHTVRFGDGVKRLLATGHRLFLEVGPGRTLSTLVRRTAEVGVADPSVPADPARPADLGNRAGPAGPSPSPVVVTSIRHPGDTLPDEAFLAAALGRLWVAGASVDWEAYQAGRGRRRISLPSYPFEGRAFWSGGETGSNLGNEAFAPEGGDAGAGRPISPDGHPRPHLATVHVPPRNDLERTVARVWEEVLGCGGIGVHDDFFELGGHSLMATRIAARLRETFPLEIPVRVVLENSTIARLSEAVQELMVRMLEEMPDDLEEDEDGGDAS